MNGAITTIEGIQSVFFQNAKAPYWTIYFGFDAKSTNRLATNEDESDMESSWQLLEHQLKTRSARGGRFLIFQTDKPKTSNGFKTKVDLPSLVPGPGGHHVAGIGYAHQQVALQVSEEKTQAMISKAVNEALEKDRMQRRIDDLEAALEDKRKGDGIGRVVMDLMENPNAQPLVHALAAKFAPHIYGTGTQVAMSGYPEAEAAEGGRTYDTDRILPCIDDIFNCVDDGYLFLEVIAHLCKTNPALVKGIYSSQKEAYLKSKKPD